MNNEAINWDEIPDIITKDQLYRICHISKSTARYLLQSGKIPCYYTGKQTRCYKIKKEDAQDSAKTKSSMRTLPLVGSFAEYFKEVKAAQELNKKVCGNCYNYEYDGYVFVDELGDLMRPDYLTSYFPQYI